MIRIDPRARAPQRGEPLLAIRPDKAAPDTPPDSDDGETWRWFTAAGYPLAYVYYSRPLREYRGEVSNERPTLGLDGTLVGHGLPPLPATAPTVGIDVPLSYEMVAGEVEATLAQHGWQFIERC